MGLYYIVELDDTLFVASDVSPYLAYWTADMTATTVKRRTEWAVEDDIYTDEAAMIMQFNQIVLRGTVAVSVRSDRLEVVYAMTDAQRNGIDLNGAITAHRADGPALASLDLHSVKISEVVPLWGPGRKELFHVANIAAPNKIRFSDKRPHHMSVRGQ